MATLSTRQQVFDHFPLLLMLKVGVMAGDSQVGMADLTLNEVCGNHCGLKHRNPAVSKAVHSTGCNTNLLTYRPKNATADVTVC